MSTTRNEGAAGVEAIRARVEQFDGDWMWHVADDEHIATWGAHMGQMLYRLPRDGQTDDMRASIEAMAHDGRVLLTALDEIQSQADSFAEQLQAERHDHGRTKAALAESRAEVAEAFARGAAWAAGDDEGSPAALLARATAAEAVVASVRELAEHWIRVGGPDSPRAYGTRLAALLPKDESPSCDHPGIEHSTFSYTGICPRCRRCKFIGHGPLCGDCYATPTTTDETEENDHA